MTDLTSPIRRFSPDWGTLSIEGKRQYLIASGQAVDWSHASSLLGKHGAVVRARRKLKRNGRTFRRDGGAQVARVRQIVEGMTVHATCDLCACAVYEIVHYSDGSRETRPVKDHRRMKYSVLCLECLDTERGRELLEHDARRGKEGT